MSCLPQKVSQFELPASICYIILSSCLSKHTVGMGHVYPCAIFKYTLYKRFCGRWIAPDCRASLGGHPRFTTTQADWLGVDKWLCAKSAHGSRLTATEIDWRKLRNSSVDQYYDRVWIKDKLRCCGNFTYVCHTQDVIWTLTVDAFCLLPARSVFLVQIIYVLPSPIITHPRWRLRAEGRGPVQRYGPTKLQTAQRHFCAFTWCHQRVLSSQKSRCGPTTDYELRDHPEKTTGSGVLRSRFGLRKWFLRSVKQHKT